MLTTIAWYQSVDPAGVAVQLNAVPDQSVRVSGADIYCPPLNHCIALAGGAESTVAPFMRFTSPSQRRKTATYISPLNTAAAAAVEPSSPAALADYRFNPIQLVQGEQLNMELSSNPAAAQTQWGVAWLSDAPVEVVKGPIFTVRGTASATLVAGTWSNSAITLTEDLPRGRYQVVGMSAISAGLVAARLVFIGGMFRPGCLGGDAASDLQNTAFRFGNMGIFGEFEDTDQPSVDFLSTSTDSSEEVFLDLIQVRDGAA
ncbi:MAG: hypothetical protein E6Q97_13605 [Desulfurellales bacterium]|nr:MAG: hypothetical protein E6Q97_13605 [Desulfurellales bacterium]